MRQRQREGQKSNTFRLAKQPTLHVHHPFLVHFFAIVPRYNVKCLNSRFVEDGNTRQQLCFSFPKLWYSPLEFKAKNIWQSKRDGISVLKFGREAARIHFLIVAVVADVPSSGRRSWTRIIRDFKIPRRGRQRERQKNNRFYKQNNNFARASRFFVHFFARFCTTTTWKCPISRFMEDIRDLKHRRRNGTTTPTESKIFPREPSGHA